MYRKIYIIQRELIDLNMNPFANHVEYNLFDVNTLFTLDLHLD